MAQPSIVENKKKPLSRASTRSEGSKGRTCGILDGKNIAILATDGVEQDELTQPRQALIDAGAKVSVVSPMEDQIQMWKHHSPADTIEVDLNLKEARTKHFDSLVLPGGVMNPDDLRVIPEAIDFVKEFVNQRLPIGAICHGPWLLVEAHALQGVNVTSWPSLKTDLMNAGAKWEDSAVVTDRNFITSRKPADLPMFSRALIEMIGQVENKTSFLAASSSDAQLRKTTERAPAPGAEAAP